MYSQAINYFERAMKIWNERELSKEKNGCEEEKVKQDNVFKHCVYNLAVIHKKMGNGSIAARLVSNFLKN